MNSRRLGLEQEFFVVEAEGDCSNRADDLVRQCRSHAIEVGLTEASFATEWVKNILEINTPPATSPESLAASYLEILQVALDAAEELGLRLYPYSVYPLHLIPVIRDEARYHVQVRTIGHERFLNAGKCAGTHLHLEVAPRTIDPRVAVAYDSAPAARRELLNTYNLATALDPVLIALSRACPFYEGQSSGLAHRTVRYRGNADYGWEGVYTKLPEVGSLRPYAQTIEELVQLQFERHYAWMEALDLADVARQAYFEAGGNLLTSSWNPVRLNNHGTVELRNIDSNLPDVVLGLMILVHRLRQRVQKESLTVTPQRDTLAFEVSHDRLLVPDFEHLESQLLYAAVSEGLTSSLVAEYTQSVLEFARIPPNASGLLAMAPQLGSFQTTEARLLEKYYPQGESLTRERGLELVREACDEFRATTAQLRKTVSSEVVS